MSKSPVTILDVIELRIIGDQTALLLNELPFLLQARGKQVRLERLLQLRLDLLGLVGRQGPRGLKFRLERIFNVYGNLLGVLDRGMRFAFV